MPGTNTCILKRFVNYALKMFYNIGPCVDEAIADERHSQPVHGVKAVQRTVGIPPVVNVIKLFVCLTVLTENENDFFG